DAPRTGTVITIDTATNRLYLFKDGQLVDKSLAATGSEKMLKNGSKVWLFRTPQGHLKVLRKIEDPVWTQPDWAFDLRQDCQVPMRRAEKPHLAPVRQHRHLKVLRKIEDPVWTKPDWAFVEAGEPVPPLDSPLRKIKGHLGKYALDLGDGIMIHGTD